MHVCNSEAHPVAVSAAQRLCGQTDWPTACPCLKLPYALEQIACRFFFSFFLIFRMIAAILISEEGYFQINANKVLCEVFRT